MDLLKIIETEVRISHLTLLKQAGMEIETGPIVYWNTPFVIYPEKIFFSNKTLWRPIQSSSVVIEWELLCLGQNMAWNEESPLYRNMQNKKNETRR